MKDKDEESDKKTVKMLTKTPTTMQMEDGKNKNSH